MNVSTPLMVTDSERTLFVQRRGGKSRGGAWTGSSGGTRRSAYFVDSDTSEASNTSDTPRRVLVAKNDALNASAAALRMGGRRILEGIRQSPGQLVYSNQQPEQKQEEQGHHNGGDHVLKRACSFSPSSDVKQDKQAPIFYGTVRFPASRVALWNRRATGSPMVLTPEGAAPTLVFRRNVVDAIASALYSKRETAKQDELQWRGILGAAADILQGQAASDPRVRYATSSVALEILGTGNERTPVSRAATTPRHSLKQGRGVPLSGALSMIIEGGEGYRGSRGHSVPYPSEEYYRALLDDCASAIKSAKSADPAIFNPLRLHCLLKRRGSGVSEWVSDGSPLAPRAIQSRPHEQALLGAGRATLSLRGEMIVPAVGVRLTPIPPLALLHTALYQSLLTRGAEDKPQSGLLTLNEGRRAVLLSDADPLTLRTPVVGVWVSGRSSDLNTAECSPSSPRSHAYTFSACLRFLLSIIGSGGKRTKAAASGDAFLVLQLQGGVNGGPPMFYEACAIHNSGKSSTATVKTNANGATGLDLSSFGFEQLDFSADVDVNVDVERESGGRRVAGYNGRPRGGEKGRGNGAVVIGRLRRVSNPLFAEPFRSAMGNSQGRQRATQLPVHQDQHQASVPGPAKPPPPPQPQSSRLTTPARGQSSRWHVRHHATVSEKSAENADPLNLAERPRTLVATSSPKAGVPGSIDSTPSPRGKLQPSGPDDATVNSNESHLVSPENGSLQPNRARDGATTPSSPTRIDSPDARVEGEGPDENVQSISPLTPTSTGSSPASAVGNSEEVVDASDRASGGDSSPPVTASTSALEQQPVTTDDGQEVSGMLRNARVVSPSETRTQGNTMALTQSGEVTKGPRSLVEASLSPPPPPPLPPATASATAGHLPGFDLDKLDPAAREFFLAQQRQLSALEEQLRLLQAAMHDRRAQGEQPPVLQPVQHQQGLQHVRLPVEPSLFSVSPSGPILVVRAATELASTQWRGEGTANRSRVERHSVGATETPKTDARATLVEASTNTSLVWHSPPPREGRDDCSASKAASVTAKTADVATPSTIAIAESDSEGTGDSARLGRHGSRHEPSMIEDDRASASSPGALCAAETPRTPDVTDAPADMRMAQRGHAVDAASQRSDRSDEEYVSSGSETEDDVLEAPSLGVRVPGQDDVDASPRPSSARHERSQREAHRVAIVAEGPASGKKASRTQEKRDNVDHRGDRDCEKSYGKRSESLAAGALGFDMRCNGGGKNSKDRVGKRDLRQRQRQHGLGADRSQMEPPAVPGLRRGASVGLMPVAELVVIPRIQYEQLTDDDLVSDLDEGETIGRIESKYLKGRGVTRMSR